MKGLKTFEEHGEILAFWLTQEEKYKGKVLICFDRHLDIKFIEDSQIEIIKSTPSNLVGNLNKKNPFNESEYYGLDNFLYVAIKLKLFSQIIWVMSGEMESEEISDIFYRNLSLIPYLGHEIKKNYSSEEYGAKTIINEVTVSATTLDKLKNLQNVFNNSVIDIDLDFFYNDRDNNLFIRSSTFINELKELNLDKKIETITYSITSGFLPEDYSYIGDEIASLINGRIERKSKKPRLDLIDYINETKKLSDSSLHILNEELNSLGPVGDKLRSILYLKTNNITKSIFYYDKATRMGEYSFWAAYCIGIYYMRKKDYNSALNWFHKKNKIIDSIETHSLILSLICYSKLNRNIEGYELSIKTKKILPLRKEGYFYKEHFSKCIKGNVNNEL